MTVSLASLHFRRPARPAKAGPAVLRAGTLPAVRVRRTSRTRSRYTLIDLASLDSLLVNDQASERGAAAEGRAERLHAACSLLIGGLVAGLLAAAALAGIIAMVTDLVRTIAQA